MNYTEGNPLPAANLAHNKSAYLHLSLFYLAICISSFINFTNLNFVSDAYYYFVLSRNLSSGKGLTFDGVSITTGFHPLWLVVTTAIHYFVDDISAFHTAVFVLCSVLIIGSHLLLSRGAVAAEIPLSVFVIVSIPVFLVNLSLFYSGVENTLLLFLLSLFLWLHYQTHLAERTRFIALGLVVALTYFCRLDSIFLVAVYLPWIVIRYWHTRRLYLLICSGFIIAAILMHWAIMYAFFSTIFPTSQLAIKGSLAKGMSANLLHAFAPFHHILTIRVREVIEAVSGSSLIETAPTVGRYLGLIVPISSVLALVAIALRYIDRRFPIFLVCLTYVLQLIYYAIFMDGWIQVWYDTFWVISTVFAVSFVATYRLRGLSTYAMTFGICLSVAAVLWGNIHRTYIPWSTHAEESQLLVDFDNGTNVLVGWSPDRASYYSGVSIRHLEGLVNGYGYLRSYLIPRRVASYLNDINATHYVISNASVLPKSLPCFTKIVADGDGRNFAYGMYESHNSYIAVYRILHLTEESHVAVWPSIECSPESRPRLQHPF